MAENIDVRARLTADDDASPKIRKLVDDIKRLEKRLKGSFAKSPLQGDLISDKLRENLRKTGGDLDALAPRYLKWARAVRNGNRMSLDGFDRLRTEIDTLQKKFDSAGRSSKKFTLGDRDRLRDLVRKAEAYRAVWNDSYQARNRLEGRLHDRAARLEEARTVHHRRQVDRRTKDLLDQSRWNFREQVNNERELERIERGRLARRREIGSHFGAARQGLSRAGGHMAGMGNRLDGNFFNSPAFYGMAAAAGTAAAIKSSMTQLFKVDTAETNLKMFGGFNDDKVRGIRTGFADKAGIKFGLGTDKVLDVITETVKAGIPDSAATIVTESVLKAATGLDMDTENTIKMAGRTATLLQDMKNFDPQQIYATMNGVAVAAKETAANANEIIAANRRGQGVLSATKMSMTDLSAFTAAGISADMPSGKVGTFMGFLTNELVGAKFARGQRGKDLSQAFKLLGMGNRNGISKKVAENPTEMLLTMFDKMGSMDEVKRTQVANLIGMREWRDELLTFVKVRDDIKRSIEAIANQPNFLDSASQQKLKSLQGRWNTINAQLSLIWEKVGYGMKLTFVQISETLNEIGGRFDNEFFGRHIEHALNGFVRGFGYDSLSQMIRSLLGDFGSFDIRSLDKTFRFMKGFAEGLKDVGKVVMTAVGGVGRLLGIDTSTADGLGRVIAQILGFSVAMHMSRPAFALLGVLKDGLLALAAGIVTLGAAVKGIMLAAGVGALAATGIALAGVAIIGGALAVAIMNWDAIKGFWNSATDFLTGRNKPEVQAQNEEYRKRANEMENAPTGWQTLKGWMNELFGIKSVKAGTLPPGYVNPDNPMRDIHKSAEKLSDTVSQMGARFQFASMSSGAGISAGAARSFGGAGSFSSSSAGSSTIGNGAVNALGLGRRGIIGGGRFSSGTPSSGFFDAIINAEGTAKGGRDPYNTVLGYGRYGTPSKNLTDMTLNEVREFGLQMRRAQAAGGTPWNKTSSASGAFQIVGSTMMDAARALGLDPNSTKFTPDTQRQMATWIARRQGLGAWEGFKHHPNELARARSAMAGGGAGDPGALAAGLIPVKASNGQTVMMDPRAGFGQAFAGGRTSAGTLAAAQAFMQGGLPGGVNRFTGFNDAYHQAKGGGSLHRFGLAGDLTLKDPSKSAEAAEAMRRQFRAAGLTDDMFKVIDEYRSKSGNWTGGHLHYQFNSQEAAARYAAFKQSQAATIAASQPTTAAGVASGVPIGIGSGGATGKNQSAIATPGIQAPITINGGNQNPEEIANAVQRRMQEAMNWRTHDMESELT